MECTNIIRGALRLYCKWNKKLDIASSPIDTSVYLANRFPIASGHTLTSSSWDMLKIVSDKVVEDHVPNTMIKISDLDNLSEFENSTWCDLEISCYGL